MKKIKNKRAVLESLVVNKRSSRGRPKTILEKAITKIYYKKTTLRRRLELLDRKHSLSASRIDGKGAHLDISSWNVWSLRIRRKNISSQKEQATYKRMSMRLAVGTDKNVGSEARLPGLISWCDLVKYLTSLCFCKTGMMIVLSFLKVGWKQYFR